MALFRWAFFCVFLCEKCSASPHGKGVLIDYQFHKIKRTTLSTIVTELYAVLRVFGTGQFLKLPWVDISGCACPLELRTDADILVTTARTTHAPEQKETTHMVDVVRRETSTGAIEDVAHPMMSCVWQTH